MSTTERNITSTDNSRRIIFIVVGIVSLILIAGLIWLMKRPVPAGGGGDNQPRLEGALRPGSPEFEKYKSLIVLDKPEAVEAGRALGDIVMTLQTTVRNFTGRTINGLEMRAAVVDSQGNPIKERTVIVVPTRQAELEPNKTLPVSVMLEGFRKTDNRADIKMEVTGVKFK